MEFKHSPVRYTKNFKRINVIRKDYFDPESFRTLDVGEEGGTKIVLGCLKGKYKQGKCSEPLKLHTILKEK